MAPKQLEDLIRIYNNVLPDEYCQQLIDYIESGDPKFIDHELKPRFHELVLDPPEVKRCVDMLNPYLQRYIDSVDCDQWFPLNYTYEYARVKKYRKNTSDQFGPHVDVGNQDTAKRFLAFLVYLNDVDEGGETYFLGINKFVRPRRGTMIVFPPLWMFPHQGKPTLSNDKYILSTYLHYL